MSSSAAERALYAFSFWVKRHDDAAAAAVRTGMSPDELAETQALYLTPGVSETLYGMPESELQARMLGLASKAYPPLVQTRRRPMTLAEWGRSGVPSGPDAYVVEHKIAQAEHKSVTDVTTEVGTALGSFSGYLAIFARDASGDTISPDGLDQTVADFTAGRRRWLLTDGHSDSAADVVAEVEDARVDSVGLAITAKWLGSDRAQALRQMVLDGAALGLSIDYNAASQPDGQGGRVLTRVDVYGGAITPRPMNGQAIITEGKTTRGGTVALGAPIVDLYANAQIESERRDPARARRQRMAEVVAASWVSPALAKSIGVEAAYRLVEGAAALAAHRQVDAADPMGQLERARWDQANRYSSDLAAWMERNR